MKNIKKSCSLILLTLLLLLVSVSSVTAADTDLNCSLSDTVNTTCLDNSNLDNCLSDDSNTEVINNNDVILDDDLNDDKYCCGAIAFQSVLKENGINISLEESNKAINSVNGSTSMQGLIDGARKYNLTAVPLKFNTSDLRTGFIVHMNIDGKGHWIPIENFTNHILVISNNQNLSINNFTPTHLDNLECKNLAGYKGKFVRENWKSGLVYVNGRWHMGGYRVLVN